MIRSFVFMDVDTQHDFVDEDGRLAVPGARSILPNLRRLTEFAARHGIPILASTDAHPPDDPEFRRFGAHCIVGTRGQRKVEATLVDGYEVANPRVIDEQVRWVLARDIPQLVVEKQDLDVFSVPATAEALSMLRPDRVFVYGLTTEYCVRCAVLGLLDRWYSVTVITDAVKAIDEAAGREALDEMQDAGASFAETESVLRFLHTEWEL